MSLSLLTQGRLLHSQHTWVWFQLFSSEPVFCRLTCSICGVLTP